MYKQSAGKRILAAPTFKPFMALLLDRKHAKGYLSLRHFSRNKPKSMQNL